MCILRTQKTISAPAQTAVDINKGLLIIVGQNYSITLTQIMTTSRINIIGSWSLSTANTNIGKGGH